MEKYVQVNIPSDKKFHDKIGFVLGEIDKETFSDGYWVTFDLETPAPEQDHETWINEDSPIWPFADFELIQLNDAHT